MLFRSKSCKEIVFGKEYELGNVKENFKPTISKSKETFIVFGKFHVQDEPLKFGIIDSLYYSAKAKIAGENEDFSHNIYNKK